MSEGQSRDLPSTTREIFTGEFVPTYQTLSDLYERNAAVLAKIDGGIKDGESIVEVGCGTGHATLVLAESNPNFGRIIGVEPSEAFLNLAGYKFGQNNVELPEEISKNPQAKQSIDSQRKRAIKFRKKVSFVLGRADGKLLPIRSDSVDRIYAASVFHWLAFSGKDNSDIGYLDRALVDLNRVLKVGGRLIFDSSGLQFDFEDETFEGRLLNSYHITGHSFMLKFLEHLNELLREKGFDQGEVIDIKSTDRYYHIFNLRFLQERLAKFGFEIIPMTDGRAYELSVFKLSPEDIARMVHDGVRMRFNLPELKDIPEEKKDNIIDQAYQQTLEEDAESLKQEGAEIMASFVFVKKYTVKDPFGIRSPIF